jgi:hypothetical protein|tara:strand:+ start:72 stop:284 length:213 start_codon:yes stop_codon:yes gene_type:complete
MKIETRKFIGFDPSGIRRVFAATYEDAVQEVKAYVLRRPDTGPLGRWVVERENDSNAHGITKRNAEHEYM